MSSRYYTRNAAALNSDRAARAGRQTKRQMTSTRERDDRPPRGRPPRLIAAGFVVAFAASIATIIYTGLLVDGPRRESAANDGAVEAGLPAVQGAGADARLERAGGNGVSVDGRPAADEAGDDPESTTGEPGDGTGIGSARGETAR